MAVTQPNRVNGYAPHSGLKDTGIFTSSRLHGVQYVAIRCNMAVSSVGLRPKSDYSGKVQKQLCSKLQTRPLVREGATK
jgi:hypothetical protein